LRAFGLNPDISLAASLENKIIQKSGGQLGLFNKFCLRYVSFELEESFKAWINGY